MASLAVDLTSALTAFICAAGAAITESLYHPFPTFSAFTEMFLKLLELLPSVRSKVIIELLPAQTISNFKKSAFPLFAYTEKVVGVKALIEERRTWLTYA